VFHGCIWSALEVEAQVLGLGAGEQEEGRGKKAMGYGDAVEAHVVRTLLYGGGGGQAMPGAGAPPPRATVTRPSS